MNTIGNYAPDFEIPGIDGKVHHLGSYRQKYRAIAVIFLNYDSLEVERSIERLKQIQADFGDRQFTIVGIDCNYRAESIEQVMAEMQQFARTKKLNFCYLRDSNQDVAKAFKVKVCPTVYLLDSDAVIRYEGRIDDCSESATGAAKHYLRDTIAVLLSGGKIAKDYIAPVGNQIVWRS